MVKFQVKEFTNKIVSDQTGSNFIYQIAVLHKLHFKKIPTFNMIDFQALSNKRI